MKQLLRDRQNLRGAVPGLDLAKWLNYVPLVFISAASISWTIKILQKNSPMTPFSPAEKDILLPTPGQPTNSATIASVEPIAIWKGPRDILDNSNTLEKISARCSGLTDIQSAGVRTPYFGKWIKLTGKVANVNDVCGKFQLHLLSLSYPHAWLTSACFDAEWKDRLAILQQGDKVSLLTYISGYGILGFSFEHSELLTVDSVSPVDKEV